MKKLTTTAKRIDIFLKIIQIIIVTIGVLGICFLIWANGADLNSFSVPLTKKYLSLDGFRLEILPEWYLSPNDVKPLFLPAAGFIAFFAAIFTIGLQLIRNILRPMKAGMPFAPTIPRDLKILSAYLLIGGWGGDFAIGLLRNKFFETLNLSQLFDLSKVRAIADFPGHQLDLSWLIIAALVLLLSFVFSYGQELQQLSDETL